MVKNQKTRFRARRVNPKSSAPEEIAVYHGQNSLTNAAGKCGYVTQQVSCYNRYHSSIDTLRANGQTLKFHKVMIKGTIYSKYPIAIIPYRLLCDKDESEIGAELSAGTQNLRTVLNANLTGNFEVTAAKMQYSKAPQAYNGTNEVFALNFSLNVTKLVNDWIHNYTKSRDFNADVSDARAGALVVLPFSEQAMRVDWVIQEEYDQIALPFNKSLRL